jgi:N-acetylglutamate synthase-like GNAT family acetyltransferase
MVTARFAREDDLARLPVIEHAAGEVFRSLGMDAVADDEVPTVEELGRYQQAGRLIVADDDGRVVAYLLLEVLATAAHVEQVSVHPDAARRGIGSQLINAAEKWAREQGLTSLTLTSYQYVPWNAPYYARLGFHVVADIEQPPELRAVRHAETARGLDAWPRVVMRRPIA